MATTIGRVDFIVGIDGSTLPTQARRFGERLGRIMSAAANARLGNELGQLRDGDLKGLDELSNRAGTQFARRFGAAFSSNFGPSLQRAIGSSGAIEDIGELVVITERAGDSARDAGRDYDGLRGELEGTNREASRSTTIFGRLREALTNIVTQTRATNASFREHSARLAMIRSRALAAFGDGERSGRGFFSVLGDLNDGWKGMAHGARQAVFYVGLFAALATQIAALGSAAGSGLTILAGAAFQAAIGIGVLVAAFVGLTGEISEMPAALQPAAAAFQALGDLFKQLGTAITTEAFAGMEGTFERFGALVTTLQPAILLVADAVGRVVDQLVNMLTSTNGIEVLTALITGAAPVFELLAGAALQLGGAIGNIFLVAQPYILQFSTWLNDILTQFNNWTQSIEGQTALQTWFENGKTIFEALLPLLGQVGDFLNDLVTPESIASLVTFMEIIGESLGPIGSFLNALNSFGIFNIIAQLLTTVFTALEPLMPAFSMLGTLVQGLLIGALQALTPLLTLAVTAFAQLAEPILSALLPAILQIVPLFGQLVTALMPLFVGLSQVAGVLAGALAPFLAQIVTLAVQLIAAFLPLIEAVVPPLVDILTTLASVIGPLLTPILDTVIAALEIVLAAFVPLLPTITELISTVLSLIEPLLELIGPILPPLTELLKFLLTTALAPLSAAFQFLTPVIKGVVDGISTFLLPIIKTVKDVLKGLADFLTNVFIGDWEAAWGAALSIVASIGKGIWNSLKGLVNGAIDIINGLIKGVNNLTGAIGIPAIPRIPKLAAGAVVRSSTIANIGEAGPEMVVPLRRPLSMVNPEVRDVAAYAQGKLDPAGSGPQVVIEEINVVEADDAAETANEVVHRIFERVGG